MHSRLLLLVASSTLFAGCAAEPIQGRAGAPASSQSILASSNPANGATVAGPVNDLELRFARPARLGELRVTGSDGSTMPMMVTAVGEVLHYSVPLPGLEAGSYTVEWKASAGGIDYQGNIEFAVR